MPSRAQKSSSPSSKTWTSTWHHLICSSFAPKASPPTNFHTTNIPLSKSNSNLFNTALHRDGDGSIQVEEAMRFIEGVGGEELDTAQERSDAYKAMMVRISTIFPQLTETFPPTRKVLNAYMSYIKPSRITLQNSLDSPLDKGSADHRVTETEIREHLARLSRSYRVGEWVKWGVGLPQVRRPSIYLCYLPHVSMPLSRVRPHSHCPADTIFTQLSNFHTIHVVQPHHETYMYSYIYIQYAEVFTSNAVTVEDFPLMINDGGKILEKEFGISSALHKQKILRALKRQVLALGTIYLFLFSIHFYVSCVTPRPLDCSPDVLVGKILLFSRTFSFHQVGYPPPPSSCRV